MSELCKLCAYEHSDCKGWKGGFSIKCDYYKKPNVFNAKEAAVRIAELQELYKHSQEQYYELMNKTRWIPVKEQDYDGAAHVLVTVKWDDDDYEVMELDYSVAKYYAENGDDERYKNWCKAIVEHVTAWMPLPEPYKKV